MDLLLLTRKSPLARLDFFVFRPAAKKKIGRT
jgi:hypothetical protein